MTTDLEDAWQCLWPDSVCYTDVCGPGSSVGIATDYGLDGSGIESRWWRDFPHLSRPVPGPTPHPASCTMGTGYFPGVKSGRGVTLTPHPLLVPWSRKSTAIPLLPLGAVRPVQILRVTFTLPLRGRLFQDTQEATNILTDDSLLPCPETNMGPYKHHHNTAGLHQHTGALGGGEV